MVCDKTRPLDDIWVCSCKLAFETRDTWIEQWMLKEILLKKCSVVRNGAKRQRKAKQSETWINIGDDFMSEV